MRVVGLASVLSLAVLACSGESSDGAEDASPAGSGGAPSGNAGDASSPSGGASAPGAGSGGSGAPAAGVASGAGGDAPGAGAGGSPSATGGSGGDSSDGGAGSGPQVQGGWTPLDPPAGAVVIHVSNAGQPGAAGTEDDPVSTIAEGYERLRDGQPDQLLLRRGDSFVMDGVFFWEKSGPPDPESGWMRFGAYGDASSPRPVIDAGAGFGYEITPGYQSDRRITSLAFTDIHFRAGERLANPEAAAEFATLSTFAIEWRGSGGPPFEHILFENLKLEGYSLGYNGGDDVHDLRIRRCIITEFFAPNDGFASGLLTTAQGLLLEENVFYRIQYPGMPAVLDESFTSHSAYIPAEARDVVAHGNFIIRATEGLMVRAGGTYTRNVSAHNFIGVQFGQANGVTPTPGGVPADLRENLILNARDGVNVGNVNGGEISDNLLIRDADGSDDVAMLLVGYNMQPGGANIGVHDTVFSGNFLSGDFVYTDDMNDAQSYSGLDFADNTTGAGVTAASIADYLSDSDLSGSTIDDLASALLQRDRESFATSLSTSAVIDFYRTAVGLDSLP